MPFINVNLPLKISTSSRDKLAKGLILAYAEIMQTQVWRPNIGILEHEAGNLVHLVGESLESIVMILVEYRRGRSGEQRLQLAHRFAELSSKILELPLESILIEFTAHDANEMYRNGAWVGEWTSNEAHR